MFDICVKNNWNNQLSNELVTNFAMESLINQLIIAATFKEPKPWQTVNSVKSIIWVH